MDARQQNIFGPHYRGGTAADRLIYYSEINVSPVQDFFASAGGFAYDTSVNSGTGAAAITRFLRDKRGFCVHFSFSMAAMARTLGIPARVAVGFTPGTTQPDGSMSVGLRDAHAWPELYFDGVGWTRFEPTPTRGTVPSYTQPDAPGDEASAPAAPEEAAPSAAPNAEPSAADSCPVQLRRQGECDSQAAPQVAAPKDSGTSGGAVVGLAAIVLVVLALLSLPLFWRRRLRGRRLRFPVGGTPEGIAAGTLAVWREVVDTAWDHGIEPDESQTPRRTAERLVRLGQLGPEASAAAHRIAGAVEQVLYAPEPRPGTGLAEDAETVRSGLRESAGRAARIRAAVAPRSAVRVIRAASERWAAFTAGWAVRWERVRRPGRPRRPSRPQGWLRG